MKLHRTSGTPDWKKTPKSSYSLWQNIAAKSYGIITPGNIISILGLVLVLIGLYLLSTDSLATGLWAIVIGRLLDIVDGMFADATKTKSPLGEVFDATADKIATVLVACALPILGIISWWLIVILLLPQILIGITILIQRLRATRVHPSRQGKISMALVWLVLIASIVAVLVPSSRTLMGGIYIVAVISSLLGIYALLQYSFPNKVANT